MKKTSLLVLCAGLAISGCVSQETFVKSNMRYSEFEVDRASCETTATQQVSANRSPGAELAVALLTGVYQTQDANAEARARNYEACMIKKGYQRVSLPACTNYQDAQNNGIGPLNAQNRVEISTASCIANDQSGRIIFHKNPAKSG
jgi:hypothetical protein